MGTESFPGVRCGRGVTLTPHPLLVQRSKVEYSYTSILPKGLRGLWKGETYLYCFLKTDAGSFNNVRNILLSSCIAGWCKAVYLPPFNIELTMLELYISPARTIKYCGVSTKEKFWHLLYITKLLFLCFFFFALHCETVIQHTPKKCTILSISI